MVRTGVFGGLSSFAETDAFRPLGMSKKLPSTSIAVLVPIAIAFRILSPNPNFPKFPIPDPSSFEDAFEGVVPNEFADIYALETDTFSTDGVLTGVERGRGRCEAEDDFSFAFGAGASLILGAPPFSGMGGRGIDGAGNRGGLEDDRGRTVPRGKEDGGAREAGIDDTCDDVGNDDVGGGEGASAALGAESWGSMGIGCVNVDGTDVEVVVDGESDVVEVKGMCDGGTGNADKRKVVASSFPGLSRPNMTRIGRRRRTIDAKRQMKEREGGGWKKEGA